MDTDIAILGAGITGLTAGYLLQGDGTRVCVLEKAARIGGAIRSERKDGFLVEYGPNSLLDTTPLLHDLFKRLHIEDDLEYANDRARNRYIVRNGRLMPLPASPLAFIRSGLFSPSAKLRLLREPFVRRADPEADESLAAFVRRRLGDEFLDYAVNPFVAGVYAGTPEALSVRSAFPRLHRLEQEYGSLIRGAVLGARKRRKSAETSKSNARLFSFRNGLQTLVDALGSALEGRLFTGVEVERMAWRGDAFDIFFRSGSQAAHLTARALLLAVPAHAYPALPAAFLRERLAGILGQIDYPPVAMVYFGFATRPASVPMDGFGFLAPEKERWNILGTIWSSTLFSGRAPDGGVALTTFVGGSRQPGNALLPADRLVDLVRADLTDLMEIRARPDLVAVKTWEKAIPQYRIGHRAVVARIEECEAAYPGLFVAGNFRDGISVADCIRQAYGMRDRVLACISS
jgi:oxygen-dependent protoporphyrinogen oxidase